MKEIILKELQGRSGQYISGEEISNRLKVSRTAIWKCINQLKTMGYVIESQTNRGYRLVQSPDSILPTEIKANLKTNKIGQNIIYFEQVDSTSLHAKRLAEHDFEEGTAILAEEQLKGKGRLGRAWASAKGKGIWMSLLLKPKINPTDAAKITLMAACAVCKAIEEVCEIYPQIKWPNDIVINGKKLCGILTEMSAELDEINHLIVGIGINVNIQPHEFSEEIRAIATSIEIEKENPILRKNLVAAILNHFESYYDVFTKTGSIQDLIAEYKQKSAILGKEVRVISSTIEQRGIAYDISEEGQLQLKLEDGSMKEIISGEVSVRGIDRYI